MPRGHHRSRKRRRPPAGADPSVLAVEAEAPGLLRMLQYSPHAWEERPAELSEVPALLQQKGITWLDLAEPDAGQLAALQKIFGLHPLAIADVAHPPQRPKYAPYADVEFFVLAAPQDGRVEQVSLFAGGSWVLTVRESASDPLEPVRERLRSPVGRIRERDAAWLAAALIGALVDSFFDPVEALREEIEDLEDELLAGGTPALSGDLHGLRRRLLLMRRAVAPMLEALLRAGRAESPQWGRDALLHIREAGDDTRQLLEIVEAAQSSAASLGDLYLSVTSARTNEVVTILTLVSTLFLPMTFLTGVWGMNFEAMPELRWRFGYLFAWAMIVSSAVALFLFFRRHGGLRAFRGPWSAHIKDDADTGAADPRQRRRANR